MNKFVFNLQLHAWTQQSDTQWRYYSGSNSFVITGDIDAEEDDDGNVTGPSGISVSGSNATIEPDWTTSISVTGGSFHFVDEYESFDASLASGDVVTNDSDNDVWIVSGSGYVFYSYSYYDSDVTVTDVDASPNRRMTVASSTDNNGFTHTTLNVQGAELSDYSAFYINGITYKQTSHSGNNYSIIPNIIRITVENSGITIVDYNDNEFGSDRLEGVYSIYDSANHIINLISDAAVWDDSTSLDVEVDGVSAGIKLVCSDFVAFCANEESISINTDVDPSFSVNENSWIWHAADNTLYFGSNLVMTGISGVGSNTAVTVTDERIVIYGAVLTNAAIDDEPITGTDNNPSNGYIINITDDGYVFEEDTVVLPTVASAAFNADRSWTFTATDGSTLEYSDVSSMLETLDGGIRIGSGAPANVTISSSAAELSIFDGSSFRAKLNGGDSYSDGQIIVDNNDTNAWIVAGSTVTLGVGETTIGGITVESTTTISKSGDTISISNATLENGSVNGVEIQGEDDDPSDGYLITLDGDTPTFVTYVPPTLTSVVNDGAFHFLDQNGAGMSYDSVSDMVATGEGGAITLRSSAPSNLTVTSYVADLLVYNGSSFRAKLNVGDSYSNNRIVTDANDINAWVVDGNSIALGTDALSISDITVDASTSIERSDDLITISNATLGSFARIGDVTISGEDDDPSDGYLITLGSGFASYLTPPQTLASIGYDGGFTFLDTRGRSMSYDDVSDMIATAAGGVLVLGSNAPTALAINSAVDNLCIYNDDADIMARLNAGDSYIADGSNVTLNDSEPINAWRTNSERNVLSVGAATLSGVSGITSLTSVLVEDRLIVLTDVTLDGSARINDSVIGGEDEDISDGYLITLGSGGWQYVQTTVPAWTTVEGGFAYSDSDVSFTLLGNDLADSDGDGAPDNVELNISNVDDYGRIMLLTGLSGSVTINGSALGVSGDSDYNAGFILDGNWVADAFSNISPGASLDADGAVVYTDGNGTYTFADGVYTIDGAAVTINNNAVELTITLEDSTIASIGNLQDGAMINGVGDASVSVNGSATINGVAYRTDDPNGVAVSGSTIDGLDANSRLTIRPSGTYVINSTTLELGDNISAYGIDATHATASNPAEVRARAAFADIPDDAEFISASQIRASLDARGSNEIHGIMFNGVKIVELNEQVDGATIDFKLSTGRKFVLVDGGGSQNVEFGTAVSNALIIEAEADGDKSIVGGDAGDTLINDSDNARVTIKAGRGNDSIVATGSGKEVIDISYGSADTINAPRGTLIRGYNPATGAVIVTPISKADLLTAIENDSLTFGHGTFSVSGGGETTLEGADDWTSMNLLDGNGDTMRVTFANRSATSVGNDATSVDQLLYGDLAELTLLGGVGNDTVLVGEGSLVDGGAGDDRISLRADGVGSNVRMSEGNDTVEVFTPEWNDTVSDRLIIDDRSEVVTYEFRGSNLLVSRGGGGGTMLVPTIKGDHVTRLYTSATAEESAKRTVLIDENVTYQEANTSEKADRYIGLGERSGIDLTSVEGDQRIDLGGLDYQNIGEVTLGGGNDYVIGSNEAETVTAGRGRSTLDMGDGDDKIVSSGNTTIIYTAGLDTVENFEAVGDGSEDEVIFNAGLTLVESFGSDVIIEAGAVDQLTLMDVADRRIKVNGLVFKAGSSLTLEDGVDGYVGTGSSAVINVGESGDNIWLNGWLGGSAYGNVHELNGSSAIGDETLVGGSFDDNMIRGGAGSNSLWGGSGGNDTLIGGVGYNEYYYLYGDGDDVIESAHDDDVVKLLNIGNDEIDWGSQRTTSNEVGIRFNDGGSLTLRSRSEVILELSDGTRWSVDRSSGSWYRRN